jgi:very-short-patch-repair endonuclease
VTAPGGARRLKGILVHRNRLGAEDTTMHEGIPVTTPGRTLVDLADVLSRRQLERAFDEAEYLRLDCSSLRPVRGRAGYRRLLCVLERHEPGSTRTRSRLEDRFLELCEANGLPRPRVNAVIDGKEVDFAFGDLIVEVDGDAAHRTKRGFERDRVRDAELTVKGYRVIRVTEQRLERDGRTVAAQLRSAVTSEYDTRS